MPSRKEEREQLRQRRLEAEAESAKVEKRRMRIVYGIALIVALPILIGFGVLISSAGNDSSGAQIDPATGSTNGVDGDDRGGTSTPSSRLVSSKQAAEKADCELRTELPDEGSTHLSEGAPTPNYSTNPPTSGNHSPSAQADGAYEEQVPDENALHALEHGRVGLQYDPDLAESVQLALKGIFDESPSGMVFFPNPDMEYAVAASAWTNLLTCETYEGEKTLTALRAFRDQYRGKGPEAVPIKSS